MAEHLKLSLLKPDKLIKVNTLQEITDPIYFIRPGVASPQGLFSTDIFGLSKDDRANIFAYIDLSDWFIHPLIFKLYSRMDKRIREIVHGTQKFVIDSKGELVKDDINGKTGIKFLKDNIEQIKIKSTDSIKRDVNIKFIMENKDAMFIKQYIVIPAYYRDVNSENGRVGVGEINELYDRLIIAVRALKETADYGLSMSDATRGRIQELILQIYDWFCAEPNISKKKGILRRANMSKTSDYASRLVLSAPELKVEKVEDLMVDLDHSAAPLASVCVDLFPYMIFYIRRFFENEFSNRLYPYLDKKTKQIRYVKVKDPLIEFSDERIKKELERFIKGYSNRFIPIKIPNEEGIDMHLAFKGRNIDPEGLSQEDILKTPLVLRRITWCDVFFLAANEMCKDKVILITRYPMDSYFNQFATKIVVSSTKETEPMYIDNNFYPRYPKIRDEDIGTDTSNKFIDTLNVTNLVLKSIGGDYDGWRALLGSDSQCESCELLESLKA